MIDSRNTKSAKRAMSNSRLETLNYFNNYNINRTKLNSKNYKIARKSINFKNNGTNLKNKSTKIINIKTNTSSHLTFPLTMMPHNYLNLVDTIFHNPLFFYPAPSTTKTHNISSNKINTSLSNSSKPKPW